MKRTVAVLVMVAGGVTADGLVAPDARAQQTTRAGAAVNQPEERRQFRYPATEAVPGLTEVLDQEVRPEPPAAAAGDRGIVWPLETPVESVITADSEPPAVVPATATQSPVTRVETGNAQIPRVEVPEVKVVAPPPPPAVRIMPASPTPVLAPASSFPVLSIPVTSP